MGVHKVRSACLGFLLFLSLGACGRPFEPSTTCEGEVFTFYLQAGVTRQCAYYGHLGESAVKVLQDSGFFSGSPSHHDVYVYRDELFDGVLGRYSTISHDIELGQSGTALAHEVLHVMFGQLHHEGWATIGAAPGAPVAFGMISPDTGEELHVLLGSYYWATRDWEQSWAEVR